MSMNLGTVTALIGIVGASFTSFFFMDNRHQHTDDAQFVTAQTSMQFLDTRIDIIDLRIKTEELKQNKDAEDLEYIKQLKDEREALRQLKMKKENQ